MPGRTDIGRDPILVAGRIAFPSAASSLHQRCSDLWISNNRVGHLEAVAVEDLPPRLVSVLWAGHAPAELVSASAPAEWRDGLLELWSLDHDRSLYDNCPGINRGRSE